MSNITEFKSRKGPQLVVECECGRQDFWLNTDGSCECRGCGMTHPWRRTYERRDHKLVKIDG